jgi:hypothetical protein
MRETDPGSWGARRRAAAVATLLGLLSVLLWVDVARPAPAEAAAPGARGKIAGYGVTTSTGGDKVVTAEAERMAAPGHNMVSLEATWAVEKRDSNKPYRTSTTVPDQDLLLAARRVREAGMNVMLTVKIFCERCPGPDGSWRGVLQPSDRAEFFRNYRVMTNHYADIARQAGAALYFVGSEMNTLQGETGAWRQVVLEARSRFSGRIGYQANWDALTGVDFWDDVDIAGVSVYFPLSDEPQPNISDLLAAWRDSDTEAHRGSDWYGQLEAFARSHGKPVLFGEVGYQSAIQAAQRPFNKEKFNGTDQQLQADLYQTVLTLFEDRPWWAGVIWWEYLISPADNSDHDYSPRGKLAEQLLTRWYAGQRPASRERSLVGTTRPSAKADGAPRETAPAKPPTSGPGASAPLPPAPTAPARTAAPGPTSTASNRSPNAVPVPPTAPVAAPPVAPPVAAPAPSTSTDVRAASPQLPPALAAVDVQTVDDALARAAQRQKHERASILAAGLLTPLLLGHAVGGYRRWRRPELFTH